MYAWAALAVVACERWATIERPDPYSDLRERIANAGLLEREYGYYAWRRGLSFALPGAALAPAMLWPHWPEVFGFAIAFTIVQLALIGHDAAHLAVFCGARANRALASLCWSFTAGIRQWYWSDRHNRYHALTNDADADTDLQWMCLADPARPRRARALAGVLVVAVPAYAALLPLVFESVRFALRELRRTRRAIELRACRRGTLGRGFHFWSAKCFGRARDLVRSACVEFGLPCYEVSAAKSYALVFAGLRRLARSCS